jgi:hypothetical protein
VSRKMFAHFAGFQQKLDHVRPRAKSATDVMVVCLARGSIIIAGSGPIRALVPRVALLAKILALIPSAKAFSGDSDDSSLAIVSGGGDADWSNCVRGSD